MLNKIKVIGMFLKKEQPENKIDNVNSVSQETEDKYSSKFEVEEGKNIESRLYFKLLTWTPSESKTTLQCFAEGEIAERIKKEVSHEEVIEVWGYLRNRNSGLEIIIKVVKFSKVELKFEEIDKKSSNQVRLLGKIINDLEPQKTKWDQEKLSFKLAVPRERVKLPLFFCRINDRIDEDPLIPKFKEKAKKNDIVILEGFLQTKKEKGKKDGETKPDKISSVNCYGFTFLDSDSTNTFNPLNNLTRVVKEVKKIVFESDKT